MQHKCMDCVCVTRQVCIYVHAQAHSVQSQSSSLVDNLLQWPEPEGLPTIDSSRTPHLHTAQGQARADSDIP